MGLYGELLNNILDVFQKLVLLIFHNVIYNSLVILIQVFNNYKGLFRLLLELNDGYDPSSSDYKTDIITTILIEQVWWVHQGSNLRPEY